MQLDELKKSMSTLEQVLAKTSSDININVEASETAQKKILKKYRQSFTATAVLAVVFAASWIGNVNPQAFPAHIRAFLVIYLVIATVWYVFMYLKLKRVDIGSLAPAKLFSATTTIRLLTLTGEIVLGIGLAVFFTLFLPNLLSVRPLAFWLCVAALALSCLWGICYLWPKYIRLFHDLNTIK